MEASFILPLVDMFQTLSSEVLSLFILLTCIICILLFLRLFGVVGLYVYNVAIIVAANIQVLKTATFSFSPEPVALGTVAFATAYLVSDIITEHYGAKVARKGVWLSFVGQILMTLMMVLTLGYAVPDAGGEGDKAHTAMVYLFAPLPRLLVASLLAYMLSQFFDIYIFQWIGRLTQGRWLWLRTNVATSFSALLDNTIFSLLAWVVLSPNPVSFKTLFFTYIFGTYLARILVSVLSTPVMYLSYYFLPRKSEPLHV